MSLDIQWQWLAFDALSRDQLYELLRLRSEVFVVEQNCVFLDMDNLDQQAMHLLGVRVAAGSAQVKEEPAQRAGDTEQNAQPHPTLTQSQSTKGLSNNLLPHPHNAPLRIQPRHHQLFHVKHQTNEA